MGPYSLIWMVMLITYVWVVIREAPNKSGFEIIYNISLIYSLALGAFRFSGNHLKPESSSSALNTS